MKKIITLSLLLATLFTFGQVPQGISYQAIALNTSGNPVASSNVRVRLSVLDASATGTTLYSETHLKMTNSQGLFNLTIGQGTVVSGVFNTINWATNSKFLKVELDVAGGTNYVAVGTTQLLSVPYALMAGKVNAEDVINEQDIIEVSNNQNSNSFMTSNSAYIFAADTSFPNNLTIYNWFSTPINGIPFMKSGNSFLTSTNAYYFGPTVLQPPNPSPNSWHEYPIAGEPLKILTNQQSSLVVTSTNLYAYSPILNNSTYDFYSTNISGEVIDISFSGFTSGILTTSNAYAFINGSWQSTNIAGTPIKVRKSNAGILFLTSTNAYIYGLDSVNPNNPSVPPTYSWHIIPITESILLD